jgi:hypothetical protein
VWPQAVLVLPRADDVALLREALVRTRAAGGDDDGVLTLALSIFARA